MNCRRIETLIPLYVEGDLERDEAAGVSRHLSSCARCSTLAAEYRESQGWLHTQASPDFGDAELDDLKAVVLSRIESSTNGSGLFRLFANMWDSWRMIAATAAVILLCAGVAFYFFSRGAARPSSSAFDTPGGLKAEDIRPGDNAPAKAEEMAPGDYPVPRRGKSLLAAKRRSRVKARPIGGRDNSLATRLEKRTQVRLEQPREMLRIEIQTSDPNIRIIWFAPKEADTNQSRPVTD